MAVNQVKTIEMDDHLDQAIELMKKYEIRQLPVLKDGIVVGMLSDRDIKRASIPEGFKGHGQESTHTVTKASSSKRT